MKLFIKNTFASIYNKKPEKYLRKDKGLDIKIHVGKVGLFHDLFIHSKYT